MNKKMKADITLLIVTLFWGFSFITTKTAISNIEIFNFLFLRFTLAFLISAIIFYKDMKCIDKNIFVKSMIAGFILFLHFLFQTEGLKTTTASKSAFITGFSVVLVPLFVSIIKREIPKLKIVLSVLIAFYGIILLSNVGFKDTNILIGDVYTFISAIAFAIYMILVEKFTSKEKAVVFGILQIGFVAIYSLIFNLKYENFYIPTDIKSISSIIFLSLFCTVFAYLAQSVAQNYTSSTHASLIYSAEPIFAGIFSYIIYLESLSTNKILGCLFIFTGMIISELKINKDSIKKLKFIKKSA